MQNTLKGMRIGFVGLGLMGKPMARHLVQAGASLTIYNRSQAVLDELRDEDMSPADSAAALASSSDIIILMVSDTPAVETVLFADNGIADGIRAGTLVIDMGTTSATATREFAQRLETAGVEYVDAPVSGGEIGARDATLSIMAGGSESAVQRAQPLFEVLGNSLVHVGDIGAGQVAKAANQVIVGLNIGAVAEALTLAKRAGVDLNKVREALLGGFAASRVLEVHGQRMIDRAFKAGGKVTTQFKDMSQAIELAAEYGQQLPATELNRALYQELIENGHGELDHSALLLAVEKQSSS